VIQKWYELVFYARHILIIRTFEAAVFVYYAINKCLLKRLSDSIFERIKKAAFLFMMVFICPVLLAKTFSDQRYVLSLLATRLKERLRTDTSRNDRIKNIFCYRFA